MGLPPKRASAHLKNRTTTRAWYIHTIPYTHIIVHIYYIIIYMYSHIISYTPYNIYYIYQSASGGHISTLYPKAYYLHIYI
jgi:hypothetical protein